MPLLTEASKLDAVLLPTPEPLDAGRALVSVPEVVAPGALDARGHVVPVAVAHRLEGEELRRSEREEGERRQRRESGRGCERLTVSGFLMKALVVPICHSSFAMPVSLRICSHPLCESPCQV